MLRSTTVYALILLIITAKKNITWDIFSEMMSKKMQKSSQATIVVTHGVYPSFIFFRYVCALVVFSDD